MIVKNNVIKALIVLLIFSFMGCARSYKPFLAMKTLDGYDLRVEKLDDKSCRCSTVFIDVRKNPDLEVRYKMQCVRGDDPIITKEKRFLKNGKIDRLITYKSDTKVTNLSLTSLDSVALYKIPQITDINFNDCRRLEKELGAINGFTKSSEYMGRRKFKKLMNKKIKI